MRERLRASDLIRFKQTGQPITMLTAWDAISASLVEDAGADVVLVGDSLAMVSLGHSTTLPVTLEQMVLHTQAVCRGLSKPLAEQPLVITDLPFLSYQCGLDRAVAAAAREQPTDGRAARVGSPRTQQSSRASDTGERRAR